MGKGWKVRLEWSCILTTELFRSWRLCVYDDYGRMIRYHNTNFIDMGYIIEQSNKNQMERSGHVTYLPICHGNEKKTYLTGVWNTMCGNL